MVSDIGTIQLCGRLHGKATISPDRMRLLGSYVWVLVLGGNAFCLHHGHPRQALQRGDALLFSPQQRHAYGSADGRAWDQIYVVFQGPIFDLLTRGDTFTQHLPLWHLQPVDLWQRRIEAVFAADHVDSAAGNLQTVARFAQLLVEMASHHAGARNDHQDAWLEETKRLLAEPQKGRWMTAQEVARLTGLSYESLRKRFREAVGLSPLQFQQQRRIELACAAIYRGNDSFKEIAEGLGFCDIYHFSRTFTRIMKVPPSIYRRQVRGG